MRNQTTDRGLSATLVGVAVLALTLGFMGGCGEDETTDPPDNTTDGGDTQPDGGGTTDGGTPDTDLAVLRLNADGTPDTSFGSSGIAKVDLGAGAGSARDSVWGLARDASGRLVLFGNRKGAPDRSDVDQVVVRLTPAGALDTTFDTDGIVALNIGNVSENARHGLIQPDGKIVASGYASQPTGVGAQSANRILLTRLNDNGSFDTTFGSKGVVNSAPLQPADPANTEWGFAEAYAVGLQSTGKYVTTGYGRTAPSGTVDLVSFRYTASGQLDTTWGTNGSYILNLIGGDERGRNMVVLPDDRVFMVGSGVPTGTNIDAMAVMLQPNGAVDTGFAPEGYKLYQFGRPDEAFFGVAVSPNGERVAAAGHVAGGGQDDDALLMVLPLTGTGAEFVQPVPLSEENNDRFTSVAFDAAGKVYGAGFINENGDSRMMVARFNADGTRDTTFGTGGVVTVNVATAGTIEVARAVLVQPDGKVVVAGFAEK